ncbi:hypothetical protein LUZ61_014316 [Rhynchospora tenuis]|uniref:3'-5' exonuclease domain-containing protein n=1 Tax=Rhynchospora tenuis TaxID=198213 RepID=A0AAD5WAN8_9POAL|nr:hypothetical protein LUZ61_014316 [Rhynchospora tenuis]
MASSYCTTRNVYSNSDNISTYLRSSYHRRHNYTTRFFGRSLDVAVTSNSRAVKSWIGKSLYIHRRRFRFYRQHSIIVGLGTQWCSFQSYRCPATIQICIGHRVLIFQILHSRSIPTALSQLLADSRITFVGYNIGYDCRLLRSFHDLVVSSSVVELRSISGMGNASMERMAEMILGFHGVAKPTWIANSDWDAQNLSVDQVQYAAVDAYLSFLLGIQLVRRPVVTMRTEQNVAFYCNAVFAHSEEDVGHRHRVEDASLLDSVPDKEPLPSRESGFYEGLVLEQERVPDDRSGLGYSEEDELDSYSGPGYFENESASYPGPGFFEGDKLDSYSGRGFFGEDELGSYAGPGYFEENGLDSYLGPGCSEDGSVSYSGPWY